MATRQSGFNFLVMNRFDLASKLVSLMKANIHEPKSILINAMACLLVESFAIAQSDAIIIAQKAYHDAAKG